MITSQNLIQLRAFARQDGLLLALLWIASFAATIFSQESPFGQLLLLATPFVVGWRMVTFRNDALDGVMSYRRAFAYSMHVFFYAALVFAVAQFLYFRYLDGGRFMMMMTQAVDMMKSIADTNQAATQMETMTKQMEDSIDEMRQLSPIDLTFLFMMMNLWIGLFASIVIALFGRKSKPAN